MAQKTGVRASRATILPKCPKNMGEYSLNKYLQATFYYFYNLRFLSFPLFTLF